MLLRRLIAGSALLFGSFDPSHAMQLQWMGGGSNLEFATAGRCTLTVHAGELGSLPPGWELVWAADGDDLHLVALNPVALCDPAIAQVQDVSIATDVFGFQEHRSFAEFCSEGSQPASTAWFVVEVPADARATFKVVALDPSDPDSQQVIQTAPITLNGGSSTPLPPVVLRSSYTHGSTAFTLDLVGAGLQSPRRVELMGPGQEWNAVLTTVASSETSLQAVGSFAALIPECVARVTSEHAIPTSSTLEAEPEPPAPEEPLSGASCYLSYTENLVVPNTTENILPKDFAFIHGWTPGHGWAFHLFYIRRDVDLPTSQTEKTIGHAYIPQEHRRFMNQWRMDDITRDRAAIEVQPGNVFDSKHVWAPHIVQVGLTFHMFYTGVDNADNESIGIATSTDLFNWTQPGGPVFTATQIGEWSVPAGRTGHDELRDPFVMRNPANASQWLMYYATVSDFDPDRMLIGMSRSTDLAEWVDGVPFYSTINPERERVESPTVFQRQGKWWLFTTDSHDETGNFLWDIYGSGNVVAPTDTTLTNWSARNELASMVRDSYENAPVEGYHYWKGLEYLRVPAGDNDYQILAAYDDNRNSVDYVTVVDHAQPYLFQEYCFVRFNDVAPRSEPSAFRIARQSASGCTFAWSSPEEGDVRLTIFDTSGRRLSRIAQQRVSAGTTEFTWDFGRPSDAVLPSGIYLARLEESGRRHTVKVVVCR